MANKLKKRIKLFLDRIKMRNEFMNDYRSYKRWNYNNPKVNSQVSHESRILRQTHIIEKGLSLSNPRKGFGIPKIFDLFGMLDNYIENGYPTDSIPFQNALFVVKKYIDVQKKMGYTNQKLEDRAADFQKYEGEVFEAGIAHTTLDELQKQINGSFPEFFNSRHSVRQFSDKEINVADLEKAVQLAMKAPTACNRQACRVYYYASKETNDKLGELIAGNTGFADEVKHYLVVTADMSAFYDSFERNQIYIETGFFSMALVEALHYYGIGSCVLQNGEFTAKNKEFKKICGNIPESERITLFIAVGNYKDEFNYAVSKRKSVNDVLIKS